EPSEEYVWHCSEGKNRTHSKGFDLCADCGALQLQWDELNGLSSVERDQRSPIRVTLQYYQATSNGVVNDDIIANIAKLLKDNIKNNWQIHLVNFKKDYILLLLISEDDLIEVMPNDLDRATFF
ncbi:hypothetical protein RFI_37623, partial [Reticulomyxa filosa]